MDNFEKPSPQTIDNPFIVIPEDKGVHRLSISKSKGCTCFLLLGISLFVTGLIIAFITIKVYYLIPIFIMPILLILLFCKCRMIIIKDKANNNLTVQEQNFFCCKKSYNITLEYADIKALLYGSETTCGCYHELSNIIVLNANPNVTDIDNNDIKNTPFKFIYRFSHYIGSPRDLDLEFVNVIENKFNNNIEEELQLYVPNKKNNRSHRIFQFYNPFFVKISDHFYMFYNYNYIHCKSSNESFRRLDWIYTDDFDRIFFGVVKNDSSYVNTFIFNIDSIDKFIIEDKDGKFCLKALLKNGLNTEICNYTIEKQRHLNIFIYLINGQINKLNNKNNQDYPEEPDNSAPTAQ